MAVRNSRPASRLDAQLRPRSLPLRKRTAPILPGRARYPRASASGRADSNRHDRRSGRGSVKFRAEVAEVRTIADSRTDEQLRIAQYWENLTGSFAAGHWNEVARGAISAHALDEAQSARVLMLVHMVG